MSTITLLIHDDRYTVPTVRLVETAEGEDPLEVARRVLGETAHHRGVELWRDDARFFTLGDTPRARLVPEGCATTQSLNES